MAPVVENVNVEPPFDVTSGDTVELEETLKSEAGPFAGPLASSTKIVQVIGTPVRSDALFAQMSVEAVVGKLYTANFGDPLDIAMPFTNAPTENPDVMPDGVVENTNVEPPFDVVRPETAASAEIEKSLARPVVAPLLPDTVIVHVTVTPTRAGFVLLHDRLEDVVGLPNTKNDGEPLLIALPFARTEMKYAVVAVDGTEENVNVAPPSKLTNPLDDALAVTVKSLARPTVGPLPAIDVSVQKMALPTRCGL